MPTAIPNGGGGTDPTTSEAAAYSRALEKMPGDRTPEEQQVVVEFEDKVTAIGNGKTDSGGTGGRQAAVALEVGRTVGRLEANRKTTIDQWARAASAGGPNAKRAYKEMHGADTAVLTEVLFLLYELRERLNDSPY